MLRGDELPLLAAHWLAAYDSPALVRLAGLDGTEGWLIDQLWPEVLSDLGVGVTADEVTWSRAVAWQVAAWRSGDRSLREVMAAVRAAHNLLGYPDEAQEAWHLNGLDDELMSAWGRPADQVWLEVEAVLKAWAARAPRF